LGQGALAGGWTVNQHHRAVLEAGWPVTSRDAARPIEQAAAGGTEDERHWRPESLLCLHRPHSYVTLSRPSNIIINYFAGRLTIQAQKIASKIIVSQNRAATAPIRQPIGIRAAISGPVAALAIASFSPSVIALESELVKGSRFAAKITLPDDVDSFFETVTTGFSDEPSVTGFICLPPSAVLFAPDEVQIVRFFHVITRFFKLP
jgi:hypothetical protein